MNHRKLLARNKKRNEDRLALDRCGNLSQWLKGMQQVSAAAAIVAMHFQKTGMAMQGVQTGRFSGRTPNIQQIERQL